MIKGINYYHETMGYLPRTIKEVQEDIDLIAQGFNSIKIYHNPFLYDTLPHVSLVAKLAKKAGLHTVWVENNDSIQFTENNWLEYRERVIKDCILASKFNVDEFLVGNEISIHNDNSADYNDTNLPLKIKELVEDCTPLTQALLSYQEGWWKKDAWNNARLGKIKKIHFTLYEDIINFESHAKDIKEKFSSRATIGEWSTQGTMASSSTDELDWVEKLMERKKILNNFNFDNYYFCFRDTGENENNKGFGLIKFDRQEPHLAYLLLT